MGVATVSIAAESLPECIGMLHGLGIRFLGSRDGDNRCVFLVIEGECVPDANMVMATIHTEHTAEKHSLTLTINEVA